MDRSSETRSINDLFQVILSNGFPRLRICTAIGIEPIDLNEAWTGSPTLRILIWNLRTSLACQQVVSLCPNLRQFKSASYLRINPSRGTIFFPLSRKIIFVFHLNKCFRPTVF
jgi:hypothetical protein